MANKLHRAYLDLYNFRSALKACLCLEFRIEKKVDNIICSVNTKRMYTTNFVQPPLPLLFHYFRGPGPFQNEQ